MAIKKQIFGKIVALHGIHESDYGRLAQELSLYPDANSRSSDIEVVLGDFSASPRPGSAASVTAPDCSGSLLADYDACRVKFAVDATGQLRTVYFHLKPQGGVRALVQKWLWYDYVDAKERIGEIFSELALVPGVVFEPTQFLLHASAVESSSSRGAILIGGSGGSGKTSLELELCLNRGYRFISDDIVPVSVQGMAFPNLCHPKIYGYNLLTASALRKKLFRHRSLADKAHWALRNHFLGPSSVRRRVSCAELFDDHATTAVPIKSYFLIVRAPVSSIRVEPIRPSDAAAASLKIMESEYSAFFNQILRYEYGLDLLQIQPRLRKADILNRWARSALEGLSQVDNYLIIAPQDMRHSRFLDEAANIVCSR